MVDLSWVSALITTFQQHHPWLTDKVGAAVVAQPVRMLWDSIKTKLGSAATEKVEAHADDSAQWEVFKSRLIVALDEDAAFQEKIRGLAEGAGISQNASGTDIRQVAVSNSENVKISVK